MNTIRIILLYSLITVPLATLSMERVNIVTSPGSPRTQERLPIYAKLSGKKSAQLALKRTLRAILADGDFQDFKHKMKEIAQGFWAEVKLQLELNEDKEAVQQFLGDDQTQELKSFQELYTLFHAKLFPSAFKRQTFIPISLPFLTDSIKSEEYPQIVKRQEALHSDCTEALKELCAKKIKTLRNDVDFAQHRSLVWKSIQYLHVYFYTLIILCTVGFYLSEPLTSKHHEKLLDVLLSTQAIPLYISLGFYFLIFGAKWLINGSPCVAFKSEIIETGDILKSELHALELLHDDFAKTAEPLVRIALPKKSTPVKVKTDFVDSDSAK